MPKISEMLLKIEGFKYATLLELNIGCYHVCIIEDTSNLCMIIIPRGKYRYKIIHIEVSNPPIFPQDNMNEMLQ